MKTISRIVGEILPEEYIPDPRPVVRRRRAVVSPLARTKQPAAPRPTKVRDARPLS